MCRKVTCKECNKPTWVGCGQHIEQALAGVPESKRCSCDRDPRPTGLISTLLGRR